MNKSLHTSFRKRLAAYRLALLVGLGIFFAACDPVADDDRYIELEAITPQRTVLLEEFTGQNCPNCPTAHRVIEALQEQYGQSLISVSIHAGSFAYAEGEFGADFQTFKTSEGDAYAAKWGISTYPSGVVNRRSGVTGFADWASFIRSEMERPANVGIELSTQVEDGQLQASVTLKPTASIQGNLLLWVVEDGIVSLQLEGSTPLLDYVHNNVYRASFNGVEGTPVTLQPNVFHNSEYTIDLHDNWSVDHLSVVAFVYDASGVLQAVKMAVNGSE